jgi:dimethylhistidine N-methyltransferase
MSQHPRYTCISLRTAKDDLARELRAALTGPQKTLPCKYLYDPAGLDLFDEICELPEYYLTRTETAILREQGRHILDLCPGGLALVELGSGSARKTRHLIEPCLARQGELLYCAIDIAPDALEQAGRGLLRDYPALRFLGLAGEFADGLGHLARREGGPRLVAFLGSTVGNFTPGELDGFLAMLRRTFRPEDRFLLGFDLLKDPAILLPAYDDAGGVTARFNLNLLARLNREYGGDFDLGAFAHRAVWSAGQGRVEMHLVSRRPQLVCLRGLGLELTFREGETVHTENCYKHTEAALRAALGRHGFVVRGAFTDPRRWFCLFLAS